MKPWTVMTPQYGEQQPAYDEQSHRGRRENTISSSDQPYVGISTRTRSANRESKQNVWKSASGPVPSMIPSVMNFVLTVEPFGR